MSNHDTSAWEPVHLEVNGTPKGSKSPQTYEYRLPYLAAGADASVYAFSFLGGKGHALDVRDVRVHRVTVTAFSGNHWGVLISRKF